MNNKQLLELCAYFSLGSPLSTPHRVYGGLLHFMWYINTSTGSYAVKQLAERIDLHNKVIIQNYETSERIASLFIKHGIPAVNALAKEGKHLLIIDGVAFLVYPWVDAQALDKDCVSEPHALKIATLLAHMHTVNLDIPGMALSDFTPLSNGAIVELINESVKHNCVFASTLLQHQEAILDAHNKYRHAIPSLQQLVVVSHGDLDQKNVLWDKNNNPIIIDWESARTLNPTYDIIHASFDWSGITTDYFDKHLFIQMVRTYQKSGGVIDRNILTAAFHSVFGWIYWMTFNIERAITATNQEEKKLGSEQVYVALDIILRLNNNIPDLIQSI